MNRFSCLFLVTAALTIWAPQPGQAQDQRIGALFNLGFMTKERVSPNWLTLGAEIVIPVGPSWSLNPEVTLWGSSFRFSSYYVVPGILANFRVGRFTFGAGIVRRFWVSRYAHDSSSEKIAPKIQIGYWSRNSRIALMMIPLSAHDYVSFGLALGMGF